jgi:hypothetical protein
MGSFQQGTIDLAEKIGHGDLVGKLIVDQVYAASQHEGHWVTGPLAGHVIRQHPKGGQAKFLEQPMFEKADDYLKNLADSVLTGFLVQAMAENMEDLADEVHDKAPRENEILRNSANPRVYDDGHEAYNRPPLFARLTSEELKELRHGDR